MELDASFPVQIGCESRELELRPAPASVLCLDRSPHPNRPSQQCSGLAYLPGHYRGHHGGKTRWQCAGRSFYWSELAGIASTRRINEHRGLMELIALNIGYDMGILSQQIFTMLVIMALVTTIMTGPLVTFFGKTRTMAAT